MVVAMPFDVATLLHVLDFFVVFSWSAVALLATLLNSFDLAAGDSFVADLTAGLTAGRCESPAAITLLLLPLPPREPVLPATPALSVVRYNMILF